MDQEIEALAVAAHAPLALLHAEAVRRGGVLPPQLRGAAKTLHALAIVYNAGRRNFADVAAHVFALVAIDSNKSALHLAVAIYDGASAIDHARCWLRSGQERKQP